MTEIIGGKLIRSDVSKNAMGGTELMAQRMLTLPSDLLENFHIVHSRLRNDLDETKIRIFVAHDLPGDPESDHLKNGGWRKYHRLVFVSNWQMQAYIKTYNIPWGRCHVLLNAIEPLKPNYEPKTVGPAVRLIYHSTPHRGLEILVPVFKRLSERYNLHLDVYSSFNLYGWGERDEQYKKVFEDIESLPNATNHGSVSQDEVREAIRQSDIFAYPSIWEETSCLCLMEAMSAGLVCVHPNLGALPETAANWTFMYQFHEEPSQHAGRFHSILEQAIKAVDDSNERLYRQLESQAGYANVFYNWNLRKIEWENFLKSLLNEPREFEVEKQMFNYRA